MKQKIVPNPLGASQSSLEGISYLVDNYFTAYNGARLREICQLLVTKILKPDVTVGLSLSGALTPAGFGTSLLSPLIEAGFIDWIVSTGANLYHDLHYSLDFELFAAQPFLDDIELRKNETIRIYDIVFKYEVLLKTDEFLRSIIQGEVFQKPMSSAEFHHHLGEYINKVEQSFGIASGLLSTAYRCGVPIYTSSPGDSSIGMNVAAVALQGSQLVIDPNRDVNETAAIAYGARGEDDRGKSAVVSLGGGSPKNFILQTQPHLHEVCGLEERGHDYFIQVTDARPDTGGLSGATPGEAVSWGKVEPNQLPDSVVCYADSTIALPIMTGYALDRAPRRSLKRLYDRRPELLERLRRDYVKGGD